MSNVGQNNTKSGRRDYAEVQVGPDKLRFVLHPSMLRGRSPFLEALLSQRWDTGKPLELPEESPDIFDEYLAFLENNNAGRDPETFLTLIKVYILADKYGDVPTANLVIDELVKQSDAYDGDSDDLLTNGSIELVFSDTPTSSPLRRLMVDLFLHNGGWDCFDELDEDNLTAGVCKFVLAVAKEHQSLKGMPVVLKSHTHPKLRKSCEELVEAVSMDQKRTEIEAWR